MKKQTPSQGDSQMLASSRRPSWAVPRYNRRDTYELTATKLPDRGRGYFIYQGEVVAALSEDQLLAIREIDTKKNPS